MSEDRLTTMPRPTSELSQADSAAGVGFSTLLYEEVQSVDEARIVQLGMGNGILLQRPPWRATLISAPF